MKREKKIALFIKTKSRQAGPKVVTPRFYLLFLFKIVLSVEGTQLLLFDFFCTSKNASVSVEHIYGIVI